MVQPCRILVLSLLLLISTESEARAYTDPGSGALMWQALVAGFMGAAFYGRKVVTWFRTKKKDREQ